MSSKPERPLLISPNGDNVPPDSTTQVQAVRPGGATTIQLDDLGPMVVNSDGTLSRISNWTQLTEAERERTLRVLSARNRIRLENEEKKLHGLEEVGGGKDSPDQPATAS